MPQVLELQHHSQRFAVRRDYVQATAPATCKLAVASARAPLKGRCARSSIALASGLRAKAVMVTAFANLALAHATRAGALCQEKTLLAAANIKFANCLATTENVLTELASVFKAGQASIAETQSVQETAAAMAHVR
mmetsp:Transcript_31527/g.61931  ORF Transcript_31527/g.61931 Transcript_31527/m.61931 type:complete len:136 (-) Transcript_31527:618-1025(-)